MLKLDLAAVINDGIRILGEETPAPRPSETQTMASVASVHEIESAAYFPFLQS